MQHNAVYPQKINVVDSTILIVSTKFIYQNLLQFFTIHHGQKRWKCLHWFATNR